MIARELRAWLHAWKRSARRRAGRGDGRLEMRGVLQVAGFCSRGGQTPVSPLHAVFAVTHPGIQGSQGRPVSLSVAVRLIQAAL
jgi:hypothetical protein